MKHVPTIAATIFMVFITGARAGEGCEITDLIAYSVEDALESRVTPFPNCDGGPAPEAAPDIHVYQPEPVSEPVVLTGNPAPVASSYTASTVTAPSGRLYGGFGAAWTEAQGIDQGKHHFEFQDQWAASVIPVGYQWANGFGLELDATYRRHGFEGEVPAAVGVLTISGCGLYQPDTFLTFDPFIRGCVGGGYVGIDPNGKDAVAGVNIGDLGYSWEAGGGLQFNVTEGGRVRARLAYSYGGVDGVSLTGVDHMDAPRYHMAGLTFLVGY